MRSSISTVEKPVRRAKCRPAASGVMFPTGDPVGYSRVFTQSDDLEHVLQDDTWVHLAHRGQRMGAWLKAETIALAQSSVPVARFLHTSNAQSNAAIQSLNRRFGFRRTEVLREVQRGGRR